MPEICRFYGIAIYILWIDHNPPHIHFTYSGYKASITIQKRIVQGKMPAKVIAKVNQWIDLHEQEILAEWEKAQKGEDTGYIEPLD